MHRSGPPAPLKVLFLTLCAAVLVGSGCAADGRDLRETQAWQTTTSRPAPTTQPGPPTSPPEAEVAASGLTLTSPDFLPGGPIPEDATCAGGAVFPEIAWSEVPPLGVELVLTLSDQTDPAAPVLLWQLAGIDPDLGRIQAGVIPVGAFETLNGFGNPGFGLPCLETMASGTRDLQFRLYVLTGPSGLAPGGAGQEAWDLVRGAALESASLLARIDNP
ncbi:MAG: hypothetical protein AAGA65_13915 [Actinomycetota bacterium]